MRRMRKILLAVLLCVGTCRAQTILLDSFNAGATTGSVRAGTSWVGNVTPGATTLTVGGTARDDNGWSASGLSLNATGMNFITVTAQRDAGNTAATFSIQFEDQNLNTQVFSVSMSAFAIGSLTTVQIPIPAWTGGFAPTQITSWSIGGGGVGTTPFRMTFDHLAFSATATGGTVAPAATGAFGAQTKAAGESVTFTIAATGTAPLTYQWFKNATTTLAANATSTTAALTLNSLTPTDAGSYTCTVTNAAGSIVSGAFTLSVTAQPATVTLASLAATFDGTAKSATATTVPAGLAVTFTYAGSATAPTNAGSYPVVATVNDPAYAGTAGGTLVIAQATQIIALGALPATVTVGTPVALSATATSGAAVTFAVLSGSATLNGTSLTPTGTALITVRATQVGNANYHPATTDFSFSTTKQNQSIAFAAIADQPSSVTSLPLAATATSGLAVSFAVLSGPASLNGATLVLTGTGTVVVRATQSGSETFNAAPDVTRSFSVAVPVVVAPPVIAQSPSSRAITIGGALSLSVNATGPGPLTYQWFKNNVALAGATAEVFALASVADTDAGSYRVDVTNSAGTTRSDAATITIVAVAQPAAPAISRQPGPQVALAGGSATFGVLASAAPAPTYQWRKNGNAIPGATSGTYTLLPVQAADAGAYDVVVANSFGSVTSSLASLTLVAAPAAPVVTRQPANLTAAVGRPAAFTVSASGTPAPTYQWRKDGAPLNGATADTLTFTSVQAAQAGRYTVTLTNSAGATTSREAFLSVPARSYAGQYFGTLGTAGSFALHIREDHTAVFLGFSAAPRTAVTSTSFAIADSGQFQFVTTDNRQFTGTISAAGSLTGTATGDAALTLSATRSSATGTTQTFAGGYDATAANLSGRVRAIANATGQLFLVVQTSAAPDAGVGTVDAAGAVRVTTAAPTPITGTLVNGALTLAISGTTFAGLGESASAVADQRLLNNSTRARAGGGDQVAIAGFVITGQDSKPVLIRAIGPTLAAFGVPGAVAAPALELFQDQGGKTISLARNTGWSAGGAAPALAAAAARVGAFALEPGTADAALFTTLAPGAYSAVISSADARAGIGLVEVYDLSGAALGQRISNLSVRAFAGSDADTLIVGVFVQGTVPKRLLIRAVGPGLTAFGVEGALAQPQLAVFSGSTEIVRNLGWSTSPDSAAIVRAAADTGAFPLTAGSADSAVLINLAPGAYTAQVSGVGGATGVALVEVYEMP